MKKGANKSHSDFLSDISLEVWRLSRAVSNVQEHTLNNSILFSIRKLEILLEKNGFEFIDMTGEDYDSGSFLDVVYVEEDEVNNQSDGLTIKEMISPIILHNKTLLRPGKVILANKYHADDRSGRNE